MDPATVKEYCRYSSKVTYLVEALGPLGGLGSGSVLERATPPLRDGGGRPAGGH